MKLENLLSLPKSLYVCFRLLCFRDAIKVPIRVRYNTRLRSLSGHITFNSKCKWSEGPKMLVGFSSVGIFDKRTSPAIIDISGEMILEGTANFGQGSKLSIGEQGKCYIGHCFNNTAEMTIVCHSGISIGNDVLVGWDTLIMDTDFHNIVNMESRIVLDRTAGISIGDHVWIGAKTTILKGSTIPSGSVVGACSLVNKKFDNNNVLIAGNPAEIKKHNVTRV